MASTCDTCLDVLQNYRDLPKKNHLGSKYLRDLTLGHHSSFQSFKKAIIEDCFICGALWRKQSRPDQEMLRYRYRNPTERENVGSALPDIPFFTELDITWAKGRVRFIWIRFAKRMENPQGLKSCQFECTDDPVTPLKSDTTSSTESFGIARHWLHDCVERHQYCNRDKPQTPWYPTRLLYLGEPNNEEESVRLIHTAQEHLVGPYMTLSHRWGSADFLKLTRATMHKFCDNILLKDMPKTFRDATIVTRALGIRYLWVDSLCIIQDKDDLSDWSYEAERMQKVYSFSHCNIFSSVSEDSSRGLFRSRDPRSVYGPKLTLATEGLETDPYPTKSHIRDFDIWDTNVTSGVLNSRGWVFQERLLAPRLLHFGHDQLFWECRQRRACETYPWNDTLWRGMTDSDGPLLRNILGPTQLTAAQQDSVQRGWRLQDWKNIVVAYSKRQLTNSGDKLIALSGITKQAALLTHDVYFAGLWRADMEIQLLWYRKSSLPGDVTVDSFPRAYRAPTWSWASRDGEIGMEFVDSKYPIRFSIEDVVLQHATQDVTGCVTGGYLDLRGYLLPMNIDVTEDFSSGRLPSGMVPSDVLHTIRTGRSNTHRSSSFKIYLDDLESYASSIGNDSIEGRLFYMVSHDSENRFMVLLLRVDPETSLYERIGIGRKHERGSTLESLVSTLKDQERAALPCLRYENGLHTIRIV